MDAETYGDDISDFIGETNEQMGYIASLPQQGNCETWKTNFVQILVKIVSSRYISLYVQGHFGNWKNVVK